MILRTWLIQIVCLSVALAPLSSHAAGLTCDERAAGIKVGAAVIGSIGGIEAGHLEPVIDWLSKDKSRSAKRLRNQLTAIAKAKAPRARQILRVFGTLLKLADGSPNRFAYILPRLLTGRGGDVVEAMILEKFKYASGRRELMRKMDGMLAPPTPLDHAGDFMDSHKNVFALATNAGLLAFDVMLVPVVPFMFPELDLLNGMKITDEQLVRDFDDVYPELKARYGTQAKFTIGIKFFAAVVLLSLAWFAVQQAYYGLIFASVPPNLRTPEMTLKQAQSISFNHWIVPPLRFLRLYPQAAPHDVGGLNVDENGQPIVSAQDVYQVASSIDAMNLDDDSDSSSSTAAH